MTIVAATPGLNVGRFATESGNPVGSGKNLSCNRGIHHIGGRGQPIQRQTGNTVYQNMTFVAPVKLVSSLIVLIGRGMDAQRTVRVAFGVILLGKPSHFMTRNAQSMASFGKSFLPVAARGISKSRH